MYCEDELDSLLYSVIGITSGSVPRMRSIYLNKKGDLVKVRARCGGGNRECYNDDDENCNCTGCDITNYVPGLPNYLGDHDWSSDCTYAIVEFSIPQKYKEICKEIARILATNPGYQPSVLKAVLSSLNGQAVPARVPEVAGKYDASYAEDYTKLYEAAVAKLNTLVCQPDEPDNEDYDDSDESDSDNDEDDAGGVIEDEADLYLSSIIQLPQI